MNFELDSQLEAFRQEVREFISTNLPQDIRWRVQHGGFMGAHEDRVTWNRILHRKGWSVPHWPVEYGGTNWTPMQHHIFNRECMMADTPRAAFQGPLLVGPVVIAVGTEEQKQRFLPPIREGTVVWCQGFSEPNAGSDLSSLRTAATREGDHYVVRGQKMWTGGAHVSDWGFFLVKTDLNVKPQLGISFLLIDMKSPGVTVRPIYTIDGKHHTNEVFLDDVKVPISNLLGEENKGWQYAKTLLGHERTSSAEIYWSRKEIEKLRAIAASERDGESALIDSPTIRLKLATLEARLRALEFSVLRVIANESNKFPEGAVTSALKLRGSELMQQISELEVEVLGPKTLRRVSHLEGGEGFADEPGWPDYVLGKAGTHLTIRGTTIMGGAREVQKNIIAKTAFSF
jgi:alkylation response protein AidB-like acyl-CoA dehydrogenase